MTGYQPIIRSEQLMYDCLHYRVRDDITQIKGEYDIKKYNKEGYLLAHQIILHSFRPLEKSKNDLLNFSDTWRKKFTFKQLQIMNVTSDELYSWSAPIDLVEQYQIYVEGNSLSSESIFYNCTYSFGPLCQYSFDLKNRSLSFAEVVKIIFEGKRTLYDYDLNRFMIFSNLSCYMHVQCCNRAGSYLACLDWREVCDGKVDCIDGGVDEQDCVQLEINECKEDEYRCHNGQCIPEGFLWDDSINPECLDRSDESDYSEYPSLCPYDPASRCEDVQCRSSINHNDEVCGDGSCITEEYKCVNKRDIFLKNAMIESTLNVPTECRDALACLTGLENCEEKLMKTEHCPKSSFQFPALPVLFGHVKCIYMKDQYNDVNQFESCCRNMCVSTLLYVLFHPLLE